MTKEELYELYFKALDLQEEGDVDGALVLFLQGANLGHDGAQNAVGIAYVYGRGVEKDKAKAIYWFKKAWRTGKQSSWCNNTALKYAELGNSRRAIYWWEKSVALGDGGAALALAKFLLKSQPGKPSARILSLVKMAAECNAPLDICLADKEEAQELLERLTVRDLQTERAA